MTTTTDSLTIRTTPDLTHWTVEALLDEYADLNKRAGQCWEKRVHVPSDVLADLDAIRTEIERRANVHESLRDATRRDAPAVAARLDAGDLNGAADEVLTWLEARR